MKAYLLEGVLSETTRKIQDFLSFKKSVPGKRYAEEDFGIIRGTGEKSEKIASAELDMKKGQGRSDFVIHGFLCNI